MSADGTWNITIHTPLGQREVKAVIATQGSTFTGHTSGPLGNQDVSGDIDGDTLKWSSKIMTPMGRLTVHFTATVNGDNITGTAKLPFGVSELVGVRA